jgi:hypothetical protein
MPTLKGQEVNEYTNVIYLSFANVEEAKNGEILQDTLIDLRGQDPRKHCASLAALLFRNQALREILEVSIEMSYRLAGEN